MVDMMDEMKAVLMVDKMVDEMVEMLVEMMAVVKVGWMVV